MDVDMVDCPIRQDTHPDGSLRCFPWKSLFHYGCLPQTIENGVDTLCGLDGDNDPIDVLDLASRSDRVQGEVYEVAIVGAICLIDEGECDWKILAVDN